VPLTTDETSRVVAAAQAHAAENGWRITVAIVDEGGLLQALSRMDGAPPLSAQIAEAKACGAALWRRDGDELVELAEGRPAFFAGVDRLARLPILPALGSVLIRRDGAVLGAVGCSGAAADQDKESGQAGLAAVGIR
jgi:glc operon protein GlcG